MNDDTVTTPGAAGGATKMPRQRRKLPADAAERLGYDLGPVGKRMGLGRNQAYDAAKAGTIPAIKIGNRWIVPAWFVRQLENGKAA
jgi:hypothetical protein